MALNFPSSPVQGQTYTGSNGVLYIYDGVKWVGSGSSSAPTVSLGNLYVTDQTIHGNQAGKAVSVAGNLVAQNLISNVGVYINNTELTTVGGVLYVGGGAVSTTANFTFESGVMHLPLQTSKLNAGGVGVTNSAEFGTDVSKSGSTVTHSEIYMSAGTAESRAIVDNSGRSLMYLGTENVGEGKFSGIVARDPNVDNQYSPGLNMMNLPTIGIAGDTYAVTVGVMNPEQLLNGLYADEDQTIITGQNNIIINNNGSHPWIFNTVGDLISSGMLRNVDGFRAVYENEIARDISDLTDNHMLLAQNGGGYDCVDIDGGGASVVYTACYTNADGGFSSSRFGVNSPVFDGGARAGSNSYTNTINGGGA